MKRTIIDPSQLELNEKVVSIKRVTKVVKGGYDRKLLLMASSIFFKAIMNRMSMFQPKSMNKLHDYSK